MSLRRLYTAKIRSFGYGGRSKELVKTATFKWEEAELIGSRATLWGTRQPTISGFGNPTYHTVKAHYPLFDIDYEGQLLPSSTPGHHHLYLNRPVSWRQYKKVLKAMVKAGLVDEVWAKCTLKDKEAFLRAPTFLKENSPRTDAEVQATDAKLKTAEEIAVEAATEKLVGLHVELVSKGAQIDPKEDAAFWESIQTQREKESAEKQAEIRRRNLGPGYC